RLLAARTVLPGVAEEIFQRQVKQARVGNSTEVALNADLDVSRGIGGLQFTQDLCGHLRKIHLPPLHLVVRSEREGEHVIDDLLHAPAGGTDAAEILATVVVEYRQILFEQNLAERVDPPSRA